jgi:hypothetical protein
VPSVAIEAEIEQEPTELIVTRPEKELTAQPEPVTL